MQHFGLRQFGRTMFTIAGIVLLIIFGARAASQASSLTAVGGEVKKAIASANEGLDRLAKWADLSAPSATRLASMKVDAGNAQVPAAGTAASAASSPGAHTPPVHSETDDTARTQGSGKSDKQADLPAADRGHTDASGNSLDTKDVK